MKPVKLTETEDGSHTLYLSELDEHYHSTKGAIAESMHVFIRNGFDYLNSWKALNILEIGFGTGLNALLTLIECRKTTKKVCYTGIEKFPLDQEIAKQLNYEENLEGSFSNELREMHNGSWNCWQEFTGDFFLRKIETDLLTFQLKDRFDLIYFDAFAPDKQPELWSEDVLRKCYRSLSDGGVLVTYSAKGLIKRRLRDIGFEVETLSGPPGKREMIRALKQ